LGLVVVDEEHDPAFKQEDRVFYHARDMAVLRGRFASCPVVLASATPSVESRVNAAHGRYRRLLLPGRFAQAALPTLEAVDLRKNPPPRGRFLSPALVSAMRDTLARGEQSLLFLNRRGYAPLTLCRACGHRFGCPSCSAWLVEHRFRGTLVCHHCGHSERRAEACPECGALDHLVACGPGVERVAEEVVELFPDARTIVLSSDMAGRRAAAAPGTPGDRAGPGRHRDRHAARGERPQLPRHDAGGRGGRRSRARQWRPARGRAHLSAP
jgi:primosomal protein N' (replication factor Y)